MQGLDRLLWVFLRLLFTDQALQRFLRQTNGAGIQADIQRLEERLRQVDNHPPSLQDEKIRRTLQDSLQTARDRLANYEKARANFEFVQLEADRLENKISSLAEMAVNRHEPDFLSSQVDQVATSMRDTERTMNELSFATGLENLDDETPQLVPQVVRGTN